MTEALDLPVEFRLFSVEFRSALENFLHILEENGDIKHFHPHDFSATGLEKLCNYRGRDLYFVAMEGSRVVAYGLLRGWDEGYKIPSLGIAIHPEFRRKGLSKSFMHFLHFAALRRGAKEIRLKVYPDNSSAVKLYQNLGYVFDEMDDQQLVGRLRLG